MFYILDGYTKTEIIKKTSSINDKFNAWVDKYIGDGVFAMVLILIFIVVAIVIITRLAKK